MLIPQYAVKITVNLIFYFIIKHDWIEIFIRKYSYCLLDHNRYLC